MSPSSAGPSAVIVPWDRKQRDGSFDASFPNDAHIPVPPHTPGASMLLWMLVDGIGLAIITACTIMEGFELWKDYFNEYLEYNVPSLTFWFSGRFCQVVGLMSLIIHAASMQVFHELELAGMMMLTAGPLLNICACSIFDSGTDVSYIFNKQWMTSESLELLGIFILDLSLIEGPEHLVLSAEITGFAILACAAVLDFEYTIGSCIPSVAIRVDLIHLSDCFGLGLLTIVAVGQYHIKLAKSKTIHDTVTYGQHQTPANNSSVKRGQLHKNGSSLPKRRQNQAQSDIGYDNYDRDKDEDSEIGDLNDLESSPFYLDDSSSRPLLHQNGQSHSQYRNGSSQLSQASSIGSGPGYKSLGKGLTPNGDKRHNGSTAQLTSAHEQHYD